MAATSGGAPKRWDIPRTILRPIATTYPIDRSREGRAGSGSGSVAEAPARAPDQKKALDAGETSRAPSERGLDRLVLLVFWGQLVRSARARRTEEQHLPVGKGEVPAVRAARTVLRLVAV